MRIFQTWKDKWIAQDLGVRAPRDHKVIIASFKSVGFVAPEELIVLYTVLDGKDEMDGAHFRLWGLDEIVKENSAPAEIGKIKDHGIMFADYLVDTWMFRVRADGKVTMDASEDEGPIVKSNSIREFLELMVKDPDEALC